MDYIGVIEQEMLNRLGDKRDKVKVGIKKITLETF